MAAAFAQQPLLPLWAQSQRLQLQAAGVVEINGGHLWIGGFAVPAEQQMGLPQLLLLSAELQQPSQVISAAELHPAPLQPHQQIGLIVGAARQLEPVALAGPVHIDLPGVDRGAVEHQRGDGFEWFGRAGQFAGGLEQAASQWIQPVARPSHGRRQCNR